jgi:hypothetical protein
VALEFSLIPAGSKLESNAQGYAVDICGSETRTFLCELHVSEHVEQESLEVSIWGSGNGQEFGRKPLLKFPQQFYSGRTKMVLDISLHTEVKFLRAKWELNRWGRVAPTPMFVVGLGLTEVPPMSRELGVSSAVAATQA